MKIDRAAAIHVRARPPSRRIFRSLPSRSRLKWPSGRGGVSGTPFAARHAAFHRFTTNKPKAKTMIVRLVAVASLAILIAGRAQAEEPDKSGYTLFDPVPDDL